MFSFSLCAVAFLSLTSLVQPAWSVPIAHRSTPVTLYATLSLQNDANIPGQSALDPWNSVVEDIERLLGIDAAYFSKENEDPNVLDLIVVFSSINFAQQFQRDLVSNGVSVALSQIMESVLSSYIVQFSNTNNILENLNSSPVTEVATFWLPPNANHATISGFNTAFAALADAVAAAEGHYYSTYGWVEGNTLNPSGQSTKTFQALVGWQSVQAHTDFTTTAPFAQTIGGLLPYLSGSNDHNDFLEKL